MSECPAPLVPADVDLSDFGFMPLQYARLRRSKTWLRCRRTPELGFYKLNLWCWSWYEKPAGSLEDDDDVLADAAMCSPDRWSAVRDEVMAGWVKCSDGRWYHETVAEKAIEAWGRKREYRLRTLRGRIALAQKRLNKAETDADREHCKALLTTLNAELLQAISSATESVTESVTRSVTGHKGQGQGQGQGESKDIPASAGAPAELHQDTDAAFALFLETAKRLKWATPRKLDADRRKALSRILKEWDGLSGWRDALAKAEASDFLAGRTPRPAEHANWRVDLDFLLSPKKFRKLMEGGYGGSTAGEPTRDTWARSLP